MFFKIKTYRDEEPYRILDEIRQPFNRAQKEFDFKNIGEKNEIVNTVWALALLSFRLSQLCESILSCKEYYSVAIIYRSLIEHSIKHSYVFMCCIKEGDDTATEYVSPDHMSSEMLKKVQKALWPLPSKFTDKLKDLKKKVDKTAEKFKFSKISEGILEIFPEDKTKEALRRNMVEYSILSSYVHAGPIAVLDLEKKPKYLLDMSSVLLTIIAYKNMIMLLSLYPSENQNKLKALGKEINNKVEKALDIYEELCLGKKNHCHSTIKGKDG